jgi:single-stranded DNA-binding protein
MINYKNITRAVGNLGCDAEILQKESKQQLYFLLGVSPVQKDGDTFWWDVYVDYPLGVDIKLIKFLKKGKLISIEGTPHFKAWNKNNKKGNAIINENQAVIMTKNYLEANKQSIALL